jgi:hypothetical protein
MLLVAPFRLRRTGGIERTFGLAAPVADTVFGRTFLVTLARDVLACFAKTDDLAHSPALDRSGSVARVRRAEGFDAKYAHTVATIAFTVDAGMQFQIRTAKLQSKV